MHRKHMTSHQISNSLCSQPTDKAVNRLTTAINRLHRLLADCATD